MARERQGLRQGKMLLGDMIEKALGSVGITSERVEKVLGRPCGCKRRRDRFNALHAWASRVLGGKVEDAEQHLGEILDDDKKEQAT